jgi:hypothetical protein
MSAARGHARIVAAAVLVAGLLVALATGPAARWTSARAATAVLATPVTVERVRLEPFARRVRIEGLTVHNPPGYGGEPLLTVRRLSVRVEAASLLDETVRLPEVRVDGYVLRVERGAGHTNLDELRRRVMDALGRDPRASRRVLVERLVVRGGRASAPGPFGRRITVPIKDREMRGIGDAERGLTQMELADFVLGLMEPSLRNAVANTDLGGLAKGLFRRGRGDDQAPGPRAPPPSRAAAPAAAQR